MPFSLLSFASTVLYAIGTGLLIPASAYLIISSKSNPPPSAYKDSIDFYVAACSILTLAAVFGVIVAFLPKNDKPDDWPQDKESLLNDVAVEQFHKDSLQTYPRVGATFMLLGGTFFLTASVLYLPNFSSSAFFLGKDLGNLGTWVFRVGSCFYLSGSLLSFRNLLCSGSSVDSAILFGIVMYIVGALLFIAGGVLSQTGHQGSSETWMVGSACFVLGAWTFLSKALGQRLGAAHDL